MDTVIRLDNISAGYNGINAVENISLDISARDFLGIIGPNGCGKTTLVKVMLGLMKPSAGNVRYYRDGNQTDNITIGYLPQHNAIDRQFPISVHEIVLSGLSSGKRPWSRYSASQRSQASEAIRIAGLEGLEKRHVGTLSGGQLQRTLLARAIVSRPEAVILDEPDTYIDNEYQSQMYDILAGLNHNCAIILVSHDIERVTNNAKRVFEIK